MHLYFYYFYISKLYMQSQGSRKSLHDLQMILTERVQAIQIGESPIEELEIKYKGTEDLQELKYILGGILTYPSTQLAKLHKHCNRLGTCDLRQDHQDNLAFEDFKQLGKQIKFCPCCGYQKQQYPLKLCTGLEDIENFGVSTFFYFITIKHLTVLMLIMTLVYSIYALVTNIIASGRYNSDDLAENFRSNIDVVSLALGSKLLDDNNAVQEQNRIFYLVQCWIGVAVILIFGLLFFVIKSRQKDVQKSIDEYTKSAADYSIIMQKVPQTFTQQDMQEQFDRYFKTIEGVPAFYMKQFKIMKYNIAKPFYLDESQFDNEQINSLNEEYSQMIQMFISWIEQRKDSDVFSVPKKQRQKYYKQYNELLQKRLKAYQKITQQILLQFEQSSKKPTTTVFITFSSNFTKKVILDENGDDVTAQLRYCLGCCQGKNRFQLLDQDGQVISNVRIRQAPEPQDIIWTNLGQTNSQLIKRKVLSFLFTLLLLGISFGCVFGLSFAQLQNPENQYLSILISLVISIVNVIIQQVIRRLTLLERDYTQTNHQASLGIKAVVALLVNSILIPILANDIIKEHNIYGVNGLAYDVFLLGITNSFLQPILKLFDGYYYFTRIMAWWQNKPSQKLYLNQPDLNIYNEYIEFETGYEYIYFVNLFLFTCFFVSLQPIISIFAMLGMTAMYWSQKYSVYSRTKRPVPGTTAVNTAMYQLIYLGPLFFSMGNFTWSHFLNESQSYEADPQNLIPNIIGVALSAIIFILPYRVIFDLTFSEEGEIEMLYEKNKIYLPSEYDRLNPSTSKQAIEEHIKYVQDYRQNILKSQTEQEQKNFQMLFVKQMGRGHYNQHNILPPIFGGPQHGSQRLIEQIFAPPSQDLNPLLINQTLFQNKNQNIFAIPVQNWHSPNEKIQPNKNVNPFFKMTESSHAMNENKEENNNNILNLLGNEGQNNSNPNNNNNLPPPPPPPPNFPHQNHGKNNAFNQLFNNQRHQLPPINQNRFQGNPYYNNQNNANNPFGNIYGNQFNRKF